MDESCHILEQVNYLKEMFTRFINVLQTSQVNINSLIL